MKKLLLSLALIAAVSGVVKPVPVQADETNPTILWDLGNLRINVPLRTISGVGLWDFRAKRGLAGVETPLAQYKRIQFVAGGVTSLDGRGTPFVGAHLLLINPAENFVPLSSFRPGFFAGRDFRNNAWVLGLKASVGLF